MSRYTVRKRALAILKQIENNPENYYLIHYACDDFNSSKIISSISVMNFSDRIIKTFDINKTAKELNISDNEIVYDNSTIQRKMLEEFNSFLYAHSRSNWISWNMENDFYGFNAIYDYSKFLNVTSPIKISESQQINLAHLLSDLYGPNFANDPKMKNLAILNKIDLSYEFKTGEKEIELLKQGKYNEISRSTVRKLIIFRSFLDKAINNKLKVNSNWIEIYGVSPQGIYNAVKDKWWFALLTFIIGIIIGHFF